MGASKALGAKHVCYWPWVCCSAASFLGEGGINATMDTTDQHGIAYYAAHNNVGPLHAQEPRECCTPRESWNQPIDIAGLLMLKLQRHPGCYFFVLTLASFRLCQARQNGGSRPVER
jgi:hypothetical protein